MLAAQHQQAYCPWLQVRVLAKGTAESAAPALPSDRGIFFLTDNFDNVGRLVKMVVKGGSDGAGSHMDPSSEGRGFVL